MSDKVLILIAAISSTSAYGAGMQSSNNDTINVVARKPEEVRREAKEFLGVTGITERPVARWIDPVCPAVLEVRKDIAKRIEARVRAAATAAGVRVAQKRCAPNFKIVFSPDAQSLLKQVASRKSGGFADLPAQERALIYANTTPVRWWHIVQKRTKDGARSMASDTPPAAGLNVGLGAVVLGGRVYQQYRSSIIGSQMVRGIVTANVVIDVKLAEGVPVDSIADYAALVGLAEVRLGKDAPANSILSLFSTDGPRELTALDQTFLRTLYGLPLDRTAGAHRGLLVKGLVRGIEPKQAKR